MGREPCFPQLQQLKLSLRPELFGRTIPLAVLLPGPSVLRRSHSPPGLGDLGRAGDGVWGDPCYLWGQTHGMSLRLL